MIGKEEASKSEGNDRNDMFSKQNESIYQHVQDNEDYDSSDLEGLLLDRNNIQNISADPVLRQPKKGKKPHRVQKFIPN